MMFWKRIYNLEMEVACMKADMKTLNDRYWTLRHQHARLLDYLGVVEVEQRARVVLEKTGGGENG